MLTEKENCILKGKTQDEAVHQILVTFIKKIVKDTCLRI